MHWSGKIVFKSQKLLSFLLDNDLSPDIATALRLFDFDVIHLKDIPEFQNRPEGVDDPAATVLVPCPARVVVQDQKDQGRERH